ncbi:hypothetical protein, partial [Paenibacillus odorifer]|uniref:hypothetical protein n=1 Tax=Paenibacillus odorifer TaxID=189426 RepID=UPI001C4CF69D
MKVQEVMYETVINQKCIELKEFLFEYQNKNGLPPEWSRPHLVDIEKRPRLQADSCTQQESACL